MRQRRESLHKEGTKPNIIVGHEALTEEHSSGNDCAEGLGAREGMPGAQSIRTEEGKEGQMW